MIFPWRIIRKEQLLAERKSRAALESQLGDKKLHIKNLNVTIDELREKCSRVNVSFLENQLDRYQARIEQLKQNVENEAMKNCPALGCQSEIPVSHAFCPEHFRQLPEKHRMALLEAVRDRDRVAFERAAGAASVWMIESRQEQEGRSIKVKDEKTGTWYEKESQR